MSKLDTDATPADVKAEQFLNAGARYEEFLLKRGASPEQAADQRLALTLFMAQEMPDIGVLEAVQELREIATRKPVPKRRPYPGREECELTPLNFLHKYYGDDIAAGGMGPGRLSVIDQRLYRAVSWELSQQNPPQDIRTYFEQLCDESKRGRTSDRRSRACATVLGTSEDAANRFFRSVSFARLEPDKIRTPRAFTL